VERKVQREEGLSSRVSDCSTRLNKMLGARLAPGAGQRTVAAVCSCSCCQRPPTRRQRASDVAVYCRRTDLVSGRSSSRKIAQRGAERGVRGDGDAGTLGDDACDARGGAGGEETNSHRLERARKDVASPPPRPPAKPTHEIGKEAPSDASRLSPTIPTAPANAASPQ
jgi:hypothetical protein